MWVTGKFMINILTKEIDFEIAKTWQEDTAPNCNYK